MEITMRALTVKQPYANLIATGQKTLEVRRRDTNYRGSLLICAGRKVMGVSYLSEDVKQFNIYPAGKAVCVVDVVGSRPMLPTDQERSWVKYGVGPWVLELDNLRGVSPFPVVGKQGIFSVNFQDYMILF